MTIFLAELLRGSRPKSDLGTLHGCLEPYCGKLPMHFKTCEYVLNRLMVSVVLLPRVVPDRAGPPLLSRQRKVRGQVRRELERVPQGCQVPLHSRCLLERSRLLFFQLHAPRCDLPRVISLFFFFCMPFFSF